MTRPAAPSITPRGSSVRAKCHFELLVLALILVASAMQFPVAVASEGPVPSTVSSLEQASPRPHTIPAIREWTGGQGVFQIEPTSRIVVSGSAHRELREVARLFAADLEPLIGRRLAVASGKPGLGDIGLDLGATDQRLGTEGYMLSVTDRVEITARSETGIFYGTQTVLQLVRQGPLAVGLAVDWPRYPERGLHVDNARKYYTPEWLKGQIREMAYLKLNYLHLHFSDDQGFRIESDTHPEIVSADALTKDEVREIIALATRHHIIVVPEIDMPGHMGAALAPHPELQLTRLDGSRIPYKLDVTKPEARAFARELIGEYLDLFPGPYWHGGADEFLWASDYPLYPQFESYAKAKYGPLANAKDAVLDFVEEMGDFVRSHGRTFRIWNDSLQGGSAVTIHPDTVVEWWTNVAPGDLPPPTPQELLDRGHQIMNASWFPTYYVLGGGDPSSVRDVCVCTPSGHPDMRPAYEEWEPNHLYGLLHPPLSPPPSTVAADEPNNLGAKLHVWGDYPDAESEEQVAESIHPRLQVIGQKTWGSPLLVPSYTEFLQIGRKIGYAPPRPTVTDINVGPSGVASDSRSPLANPLWEPSFIIDEHMATRWVSGLGAVNQDDEWVQVELLEPRRISRVVLYWEAAYGKAYSIQVSTDGTTWRDAATVQDGDGGEDEILLDMAEPATFVRMRGIQRGTPHAYSLWEMEIYSPTGE